LETFSSTAAFLIASVAPLKRHPINTNFGGGNREKSAGVRVGVYGELSIVITLILLRNP
jgi:hypothetical protein